MYWQLAKIFFPVHVHSFTDAVTELNVLNCKSLLSFSSSCSLSESFDGSALPRLIPVGCDVFVVAPFIAIQNKEINQLIRKCLPPANEVCAGYVFIGVCLSTAGGVSACGRTRADTPWADPLGQTPPGQTPPWADTSCPVHAGIHRHLSPVQ